MLTSEIEYEQAVEAMKDLKQQYGCLSAIDKRRPYIGGELAKTIHKLGSDIKTWEYDRPEKPSKLVQD